MSNHERSHEKKSSSHETWKDKLKGKHIIIAAVATGVLALSVGGAILAGNSLQKDTSPTTSQEQQGSSSLEDTIDKELEAKPKLSIEEIRAKYDKNALSAEEITEQFKIASGLNSDQFGDALAKSLKKASDCGYDQSLREEYLHENTNRNTFINSRLAGIASYCVDNLSKGLFAKDSQGLESISKFKKSLEEALAFNLDLRVLTDDGTAENEQPYSSDFKVIEVKEEYTSEDGATRVLAIKIKETANTDKNRADEITPGIIGPSGKIRSFGVNIYDNGSNIVITDIVEY